MAVVRLAIEARDAEIERLLTSIGEQALVIEQQDRDMERIRAGLTKMKDELDDRYYDVNRDWLRSELAAILEGAPCTEATK